MTTHFFKTCTFFLLLAGSLPAAEMFVPDGRVNPDDYTVLMAVDAPLPAECRAFNGGAHGKFFVEGWTRSEQNFRWEITVPAGDVYAVNVLARRKSSAPLTLKVSCGGDSVAGRFNAAVNSWDRLKLDGTLHLSAGKQVLTLEAVGTNFAASAMSVELVKPAVSERLQAAALKLRADTTWLQQVRYGIMCHWTSQSFPRQGPRKVYADAVKAFDVEKFAEQVRETGAGFLVLTTSHAEMYFPAPIKALELILPGRTTERDLVAELASALNKRGIKLMLYYHLGASSDPTWTRASGFWETEKQKFFGNWSAVVREIGERYGDKLAGWWFDDGSVNYYYRSAPWENLTRTAKAGHPQRLVGYNPWELPSPTAFQDYYCGEGNSDSSHGGMLAPGGDGHFKTGTHQGLQACATLITEGDWVHSRQDTEIGAPHWNEAQLASLLKAFIARKNVPIFNFEIYQEGALSPASVELFKRARQSLDMKQR